MSSFNINNVNESLYDIESYTHRMGKNTGKRDIGFRHGNSRGLSTFETPFCGVKSFHHEEPGKYVMDVLRTRKTAPYLKPETCSYEQVNEFAQLYMNTQQYAEFTKMSFETEFESCNYVNTILRNSVENFFDSIEKMHEKIVDFYLNNRELLPKDVKSSVNDFLEDEDNAELDETKLLTKLRKIISKGIDQLVSKDSRTDEEISRTESQKRAADSFFMRFNNWWLGNDRQEYLKVFVNFHDGFSAMNVPEGLFKSTETLSRDGLTFHRCEVVQENFGKKSSMTVWTFSLKEQEFYNFIEQYRYAKYLCIPQCRENQNKGRIRYQLIASRIAVGKPYERTVSDPSSLDFNTNFEFSSPQTSTSVPVVLEQKANAGAGKVEDETESSSDDDDSDISDDE